jgi:hypothetical protein
MNRRGFLTGLSSLVIAAPAIVRAPSLMRLRGHTLIIPPALLEQPATYAGGITWTDFARTTMMLDGRVVVTRRRDGRITVLFKKTG